MRERETEGETERERQRDRETERHRDRETERQRDRERRIFWHSRMSDDYDEQKPFE